VALRRCRVCSAHKKRNRFYVSDLW